MLAFVLVANLPIGSVPPQQQTFELTRTASGRVPTPVPVRLDAASARPLQPIVFGFGRLGDMVMLSSVAHLLHQRFGRRCLVVGAGAWNSQLYRDHPNVERVLSFSRHMPFMLSSAWWQVLFALHHSSPGPIYVCERSPRQLNRIRRMLKISAIDPSRCLFITDVADAGEHWTDRYVRLGQLTPPAISATDYQLTPPAIGASEYPLSFSVKPAPRLSVSDTERAELGGWLRARGWLGRKLVMVQPGNFRSMSRRRERWRWLNADDKAWPVENWVCLVRKVLGTLPDALVVLCGAPQEGEMLREIQLAAGTPDVIAAELGLRQLLGMSESAHSMISVDTGPAHAAAALGLPLVVMFGAESPREWLPRSPSGSSVLGIGGPPVSRRVDQISVEAVFGAWCSLLPTVHNRQTSAPLQSGCAY
jgi:ADP-heptose:LPS heptosyltransferase